MASHSLILLVEDVEDVGMSGEVVKVRAGYARNFLLPKKKAVRADRFTLRLQAKLKEERAKRAAAERKESEELAAQLRGVELTWFVKVDPDGHMYGSVSSSDIVDLLQQEGIVTLQRRHVSLAHPIKTLGTHTITLRLKEGVPAEFTLHIYAEGTEQPVSDESVEEQNQEEET